MGRYILDEDEPPPLTKNIEEAIADLERVEGMWPEIDITIETPKWTTATEQEQKSAQAIAPFPGTYEDYKAARRAYRAIFAPLPPHMSHMPIPREVEIPPSPILTLGNVISQLYALIEDGLDPNTPIRYGPEDNSTWIRIVRVVDGEVLLG